jgi:hypothetical protein
MACTVISIIDIWTEQVPSDPFTLIYFLLCLCCSSTSFRHQFMLLWAYSFFLM